MATLSKRLRVFRFPLINTCNFPALLSSREAGAALVSWLALQSGLSSKQPRKDVLKKKRSHTAAPPYDLFHNVSFTSYN